MFTYKKAMIITNIVLVIHCAFSTIPILCASGSMHALTLDGFSLYFHLTTIDTELILNCSSQSGLIMFYLLLIILLMIVLFLDVTTMYRWRVCYYKTFQIRKNSSHSNYRITHQLA